MIIREMTPDDIEQAAAIEEQCFSLPWSKKSFLDSISREDTIFLVAEQSEGQVTQQQEKLLGRTNVLQSNGCHVMGYIGMYLAFEEGEITNVAVLPECRKQGIGNKLVVAMQNAGKERGLERIVLEVRVSNTNAISLYKRNGFAELGIRKNFYEKPVEDAFIMACKI